MKINTLASCIAGIVWLSSMPLHAVTATPPSALAQWQHSLLQAVREAKMPPPAVARALAIVNTCAYDAWAAYDNTALPSQGTASRVPQHLRTLANKTQATSYAAYVAAVNLFPAQQARFEALLHRQGYSLGGIGGNGNSHQARAKAVCDAILTQRRTDGANQYGDLAPGAYSDYTGYQPVNTPEEITDISRWQPQRVDGQTQRFTLPHWYKVKPFSLTRAEQFLHPQAQPAQAGSPAFTEQAKQVLALSAGLSDYQKAAAEYWADGPATETPPGHWHLIALGVSQRRQHSLDQDAKLFFALSTALHDAGVSAWAAKRQADSVRPISAIRQLYAGQTLNAWAGPGLGTQPIPAEQWQPYLPTPPFGEWVSGHSTFSAAAATVLRLYTGSDAYGGTITLYAGSSKIEPGSSPSKDLTLTWPTFSSAAREAGASRLYGGIHFPAGNVQGLRIGSAVGRWSWHYANRLFTGNQTPCLLGCNVPNPSMLLKGDGLPEDLTTKPIDTDQPVQIQPMPGAVPL
jgi:hypothetical protein